MTNAKYILTVVDMHPMVTFKVHLFFSWIQQNIFLKFCQIPTLYLVQLAINWGFPFITNNKHCVPLDYLMDILCKKTSNQIDVSFKQIVRTSHWHKTPLPLEMRRLFRKRNKQQFVQQLQKVLPNIKKVIRFLAVCGTQGP